MIYPKMTPYKPSTEYFQNFPKGGRILKKKAGVTELLGDLMNFRASPTCLTGHFHTDSTPDFLSSVEMSNQRIFHRKILPPPQFENYGSELSVLQAKSLKMT